MFDLHPEKYEDIYTDYTVVGWKFNFPITDIATFFSDTVDNPDFIYTVFTSQDVWTKEDYDYKKDTFIIEGTNIGITFSDAFGKESFELYWNSVYNPIIEFDWYSEKHPILITTVEVFIKNNIYYMTCLNSFKAYEISDEFLAILQDNDIIA